MMLSESGNDSLPAPSVLNVQVPRMGRIFPNSASFLTAGGNFLSSFFLCLQILPELELSPPDKAPDKVQEMIGKVLFLP